MRKSWAIVGLGLTLGLLAFGCDDDGDGTATDAKTDASDGGASDGLPRDGAGGDGVVRLDGGDAPGVNSEVGEAGSETAPDLAPEVPSGPTTWTSCMDPKNGVSAADFCAQYGTACGFDPAGGTAMAERYKSAEDCVAKYNVGSPARRGCVAYHLCVASQDATAKALHCPHPPQASLPVPVGPGPCGNM